MVPKRGGDGPWGLDGQHRRERDGLTGRERRSVYNDLPGFTVISGTQVAGALMSSAAIANGVAGGNAPHSMFCVGRFTSFGVNRFMGLCNYGGGSVGVSSSGIGHNGTSSNSVWYGGSNLTSGVTSFVYDQKWHVYSKTFDGATILGYLDGVQVVSQSFGSFVCGTILNLFSYNTTTSGSADCMIAEAGFFSTAVSPTNRFTLDSVPRALSSICCYSKRAVLGRGCS